MSTGGLEDGDSLIPSGFFGDSNTGTNSPDNATSSSFANFIEQLLIKESTQHRQTILITSAFSIAASILVISAILAIQLVKTVQIDKTRNINRTASEVADILVTLNGLLQAVLHLLLRVNSERLAIRPRETPWTGKRKIRLLGPNDVNIHEFISSPLLLQRDSSGSRWSRAIKETDVQKINLARQLQSQPLTPPITPQQPTAALSPRANAQPSPMPRPLVSAVTRRPSNTQYSLFPTEASGRLPVESWVTEFSTESEETIEPPAPLFTSRHGRNSSTQTSETVEFALRLSHRAADMLSPIAPTPVEPVSHSRLGLGDSMLSPMRYVRPSSPNRPAMTTDTEAIPSQATRVAFERPKVTPTLSTLKLQRPKRTTSLRNSFAVMGSQRRREVDKSLPPLPRNSAVDAPVAEAPKAPNWRDSSRKHKPENAFPQRVPFEFPSPVEELWPAQKPPEWI
ncbi:MAG: hypothetical protein LQ340_003550 [Diploschistes diacapsis]|nr:MAG: hypothetical protein LQ340_003550 [Diploschistes diacapsis]